LLHLERQQLVQGIRRGIEHLRYLVPGFDLRLRMSEGLLSGWILVCQSLCASKPTRRRPG
jgi:hypothetical protein